MLAMAEGEAAIRLKTEEECEAFEDGYYERVRSRVLYTVEMTAAWQLGARKRRNEGCRQCREEGCCRG